MLDLITIPVKIANKLLYGVRPINWAGCWNKEGYLISGRCIAYFEIEEDAEEYIILLIKNGTHQQKVQLSSLYGEFGKGDK